MQKNWIQKMKIIGSKKQWKVTWNNHSIIVTNEWGISLWIPPKLTTRCTLIVDNQLLDSSEILFLPYEELTGTTSSESNTVTIRAIIGAKNLISMGCKIYVNNVLVGGDIKSQLMDIYRNPIA